MSLSPHTHTLQQGDPELKYKWLAQQYPRMALHKAAKRKDQQLFLRLLATPGVRVDAKDGNDNRPLHLASELGWVQAVGTLLARREELRVDVSSRNDKGAAALHCAALCADDHNALQCVRLLLDAGAVADAKDQCRFTPLHHVASQSGKAGVAELLLQHGAEANAKNLWGVTPLHIAAEYGQVAIVNVLLGHAGIDIRALDQHGTTPLMWARRHGKDEVVSLLSACMLL